MELLRLLGLVMIALLVASCAGSKGLGTGVPGSRADAVLPQDVRVIAPRPDMESNKARFSGIWSGVWIGLGDRLPHTLVVETLSEQTFSGVYATGDSLTPGLSLQARWWRIYGTVESGRLTAKLPPSAGDATVTYVLNSDGTVSGTFTNRLGFSSKAHLTKTGAGG